MPLLAVDAVEKLFDSLAAVDGVTFGVDEGEILAIVGPNGAGKSTLLRTIGGIERPSAGGVTFAGEKMDGLTPHEIRRKGIAIVMQTPLMFASMTTLENVVLGAMFGAGGGVVAEAEAVRRAKEALDFVGLLDRSDQPVGSLNLHEQRFVEMAKALAGRPRLLLVDEVMAGLNHVELESSIRVVRTARDALGITIIWVEHVMKAVMSLAERVIVLNFGRTLSEGEPEIVMRNPDVINAYLGEGNHA
jgi:ABC-type branched-subunit amino acid transport system ATPase component